MPGSPQRPVIWARRSSASMIPCRLPASRWSARPSSTSGRAVSGWPCRLATSPRARRASARSDVPPSSSPDGQPLRPGGAGGAEVAPLHGEAAFLPQDAGESRGRTPLPGQAQALVVQGGRAGVVAALIGLPGGAGQVLRLRGAQVPPEGRDLFLEGPPALRLSAACWRRCAARRGPSRRASLAAPAGPRQGLLVVRLRRAEVALQQIDPPQALQRLGHPPLVTLRAPQGQAALLEGPGAGVVTAVPGQPAGPPERQGPRLAGAPSPTRRASSSQRCPSSRYPWPAQKCSSIPARRRPAAGSGCASSQPRAARRLSCSRSRRWRSAAW